MSPEIIKVCLSVEDLKHASTSKEIVCDICGKKFQNNGAKRMHTVKTHLVLKEDTDVNLRFKNRAIDDLSKELRFYCPVDKCIKFFKEKKLLIQHFQKSHGEKKFECNLCQTKFSLERDLKYHKTKTCPIAKGLELTQSIVDGFEKMTLLEPEKKKDSLKDKEIKKKVQNCSTQTDISKDQQTGKWVLIPVVFTSMSSRRTVILQTEEEARVMPEINPNETPQSNFEAQSYEPYSSAPNYESSTSNYVYSTQIQEPPYPPQDSYSYLPSCSAQTEPYPSSFQHNETQTIPTYETDTSYWQPNAVATQTGQIHGGVATQTAGFNWSRSQQDFGTQFSWDDFSNQEPIPIDQQYNVQGTQTLPLEEIDQIDWFGSSNIPSIRETNEIGSMTDDLYEIHQISSA